MKEIIYSKLVRDKIPEIIKDSGKECFCHVLDDEEYRKSLKAKLYEETKEVECAKNDEELNEELADVVEIIAALAVSNGKCLGDIIKIASDKRTKRGGFDKKIFLEKVIEK